jgi:hypothetical protein
VVVLRAAIDEGDACDPTDDVDVETAAGAYRKACSTLCQPVNTNRAMLNSTARRDNPPRTSRLPRCSTPALPLWPKVASKVLLQHLDNSRNYSDHLIKTARKRS